LAAQPELIGELREWLPQPRHKRLLEWMSENDVDALVGIGARNATYLTGYSRYWGGPATVILQADGTTTLCVMRDEVQVAEELSDADRVIGYGEHGFGINLDPVSVMLDEVSGLASVGTAARIALSDAGDGAGAGLAARIAARIAADTVDAGAVMHQCQGVKDEDELRKILWSYELCWLAHRTVAEHAARGETEIEMFSAAAYAAQVAHGAPTEFLTDLLSGPNTVKVCCPIHVAGSRRVGPGEPVVADIVVGASGYYGDSAETHIVGSNDAVAEKRSGLLEIMRACAEQLRPGVTGAQIFEDMAARISAAFPGGEFPHHAGHGVGLSSFEDPHMIPSDTTALENFMVIALEPGVYGLDGIGARVENLFVVTPQGGVELRSAFDGSEEPQLGQARP
jgi:Xaa-Pro aminopeptidase